MNDHAARGGIGGIVFDAVGTLIEPYPSVATVYAEAAERQGVELDPTVVRARFREFFQQAELADTWSTFATDEDNERRRWQRIVRNVLQEVLDHDLAFEELWEHFGRPTAWRCFDDVRPTLEKLESLGIPVWIASNFDARLRSVVAGLSELSTSIKGVVISSEVGYRKPHPSFFDALIDQSGQSADSLLCVGDDVENDVLGSTRAGLRGIWLDREGKGQGEIPPRIPDLSALLQFVER